MAFWAWCIAGMVVALIILAFVIAFYWLIARGHQKSRKVYIEPLPDKGGPPEDDDEGPRP